MHPHRIAAVRIADVNGDSLAEIQLHRIDTGPEHRSQMFLPPAPRLRVGEVHNRHAVLPVIGLPHAAAVPAHQEVALLCPFLKHRRVLGHIRIDPASHLQSPRVVTGQHCLGIREDRLVPFHAAEAEFLHPEAVQIEDGKRNRTALHLVDHRRHRLLIITGGEGGGEPESEGPGRRQRGTSGHARIGPQHILQVRPVEQGVGHRFALHAEPDRADLLAADLKRNIPRIIDEDAVSLAGQIEGNVLVGPLRRSAAVLVPHIDLLAVFDKFREALAESVDLLIRPDRQLRQHIRRTVLLGKIPLVRPVGSRLRVPADIGGVPEAAAGDHLSVRLELIGAVRLADPHA